MSAHPIATITMRGGGVMRLALYPEHAPNTVANFVELAERGFFDGQLFHRCVAGFVIQGGSPDGTCDGSPGFLIRGEFAENGHDNPLRHVRGAISMARDPQPDTAGSQFFIVHRDAHRLDGKYAAFGYMLEGSETLDDIAGQPTHDPDNTPDAPQVMHSVRIAREGYVPPGVERLPENAKAE